MARRPPASPIGWIALTLAAAACAGGCAGIPQPQGRTGVQASYDLDGTLRANLPARIGVFSALAAGGATLSTRGYMIVRNQGTADQGEVSGCEAVEGFGRFFAPEATVRAEVAGPYTAITVKIDPWGNEAESRAILADMLATLGL